ncbi:hypothetical protein RF55_24471 [Lasius niger]|uniref:Uncharacterized protein n=1 Tax=Lasius niger TaxID=67767 RepID=A0A0J7MN28_LASNI|nr:hypothetical protein RF55_24471 [Lasius niger]
MRKDTTQVALTERHAALEIEKAEQQKDEQKDTQDKDDEQQIIEADIQQEERNGQIYVQMQRQFNFYQYKELMREGNKRLLKDCYVLLLIGRT